MAAVTAGRAYAIVVLLFATAPLAGCGSLLTEGTADAAGLAGAGIAGAVTKNAAVGAGIGLGVTALANAGLMYAERRVHAYQQDSIAEAAGPLPEGAVGAWHVSPLVPIEDEAHGEVVVSRVIGGGAFLCKEIVFSVDTGSGTQRDRAFYTATVCRDGERWRWATAEPATARWGALQQ
jgi:hypothetical protein